MTARTTVVLDLLQGIVISSRCLSDLAAIATREEAALLPLLDDVAHLIAYRAAVAVDLLKGGQPRAVAPAELLPAGAMEALSALRQEGGAA